MPAQLGSSVLLSYGNQGARQLGGSVVLSYDQGLAPAGIRITTTTQVPWHKSTLAKAVTSAIQPANIRQDISRAVPWEPSAGLDALRKMPWLSPLFADDKLDASWGAFGAMLNPEQLARWSRASKNDAQRIGLWRAFGLALDEARGSRWRGSKPSDVNRYGVWVKPERAVILPRPFIRPAASEVDFRVLGGGILADFPAGAYIPPLGDLIVAAFGDTPYRVPKMHREAIRAPGNAAHFNYRPDLIPALDALGNPRLQDGRCDPFKIVIWNDQKRADREGIHPWTRYSRPMNPGWGVVTPPGPVTPGDGETITIPVKRVYIVVNEILFARVDDATVIPASQLSIAFDCDSWLPTFSATIPETSRDAVMPDPSPIEVMAYINGSEFKFFVERIARSRQFGQRTVSISGRALACELDAPYAEAAQHTNSAAMTAQQLIADALEFTGYTQSWNITDWLVPGGAFSLHGTPAQVAGAVAEASGSVLAADWFGRDLRMLARYPVKPWDWATATPDYVIPSAITQTESIEWQEKPSYNVVYVSGVQTGVLGQVKISGTAGDKAAPMVTHQLITHNDAARQRGISILSDTGRKAMMQISLPVLETTGIIDICRLIEFSDGANTRRGIVRANNITVNWPTVRQTLSIEASV